MKFLNFLSYHNAVPIGIFVLFLSAGGAYAATNPDAILSSQQKVLTVDNTYIVNKDLSTYSPQVLITSITEDADSYTVNYTISTIDIDSYVWKDVVKPEVMVVEKADLKGGDLGLYVTGQFKNIISNQLSFLASVQEKERKQISQETVATTYGGLVGKFLTAKTETLPGYSPVTNATSSNAFAVAPEPAAVAISSGDASANGNTGGSNASSQQSSVLSLQVLGNNPAVIPLNSGYNDLGVVLIDPTAPNLGYYTFVDGVQQTTPNIDTRTAGAHVIEYRATDQNGVAVLTRRIVLVGDATDPGGEINTAGSVLTPSAPNTPVQTPAPVQTTPIVTVPEPTQDASTTSTDTTSTTDSSANTTSASTTNTQ